MLSGASGAPVISTLIQFAVFMFLRGASGKTSGKPLEASRATVRSTLIQFAGFLIFVGKLPRASRDTVEVNVFTPRKHARSFTFQILNISNFLKV